MDEHGDGQKDRDNRTSLSLFENGRRDPHLVTVRRIARASGVSVEEFLYGEVRETT